MWESEEVQKVLLAYNDEGNTTTSYSAYLKNNLFITTDENGEPMIGHKEVSFMGKQVTREDVEIAIQRGNLSVEEANKLRDAYGFGNNEDSAATKIIKERTGWDGSDINVKGVIINQDKLQDYGMTQEYGACVFGATYMATERVSNNQLLPADETYNASQLNGAMGGENGNMYINDYQKFAKTSHAYDVSIPNDGIVIDYKTEQGKIDATVGIIKSLTSGGQNIIRFDGHSVENNGAFIDKGDIILRIEDPKREYQFLDTTNMKLFNYVDEQKDDYGIRKIVNYRPVTNSSEKEKKK